MAMSKGLNIINIIKGTKNQYKGSWKTPVEAAFIPLPQLATSVSVSVAVLVIQSAISAPRATAQVLPSENLTICYSTPGC